MNILYENLAGDGGGVASYKVLLHRLAIDFPQDQFTILCLESSTFHSLSQLSNVQTVSVPKGEFSRFYANTAGMRRLVRETKADVVWTTNIGPYLRTGVPQVLSVVNAFQVYPWSVARYHPHSKISVAALRWFFRISLKQCDAVLVETPMMGEYVRRWPNAPEWVHAIPKAVESMDDFEPQPLPTPMAEQFDGGLGRDAFTFLYVATRSPHKNHTTLFFAMKLLRSQGVNGRIALSLDRESSIATCSDRLLARSLIESGHILPLGWISKQELAAAYNASDACVMPSVLESQSSAHLEAMHWRKPQIAADLPYSHDLCGEAAIYALPQDPADWAAKMLQLMNSHTLQESLTEAGVSRMKDYPQTWQAVARHIRTFLAGVHDRYHGQ